MVNDRLEDVADA